MSVTLVEGGDLEKLKSWTPSSDKFSNRVVSLTNTTKSFLESESIYIDRYPTILIFSGIGVWNHVNGGRTCQLQSMQVRHPSSPTTVQTKITLHRSGMAYLTQE